MFFFPWYPRTCNYMFCIFSGVVAGSSAQHFGVMKTVIVGTLLSSLGLFATSFSTNIYIMYFAFGFLPGKSGILSK